MTSKNRVRGDVSFPTVEKNSTIIFPAQFMTTVQEAIALLSKDSASKKLRNIFSHRTLGFTCPLLKNSEMLRKPTELRDRSLFS